MKIIRTLLLASVAAGAFTASSYAQPQQAQTPGTSVGAGETLETVVVTGVLKDTSIFRAASAVSTFSSDEIMQIAPLSSSDLLHGIPGVHVESSGGESNANVSFRGLPISAGGAKYVHFDEDGLPVLEFGDIAFGNADSYIKADYTIDRVEVVRGGAAATYESNSPGGIINFISKTGDEEGGVVGITKGLNYDTTRIDFDYGGPLGSGMKFNVGGYYHIGEGERRAGFTAQNGGQIKANFTKEFSHGFVRLSVKFLDDRTPTYLATPFSFSGTGMDPHYGAIPGFNELQGTFLTPYLQTNSGLGVDGNHFTHKMSDGWHVVVRQIGGEFSFEVAKGTHLDDKIKFSQISSDFMGPFLDSFGDAADVAAATTVDHIHHHHTHTLTGGTFTYANGPHAGDPYTGLVARIVLFDTQVPKLDNFTNNLQLSHVFDVGDGGTLTLTGGYYKSKQDIVMDWNWNSYFMEVSSHNAALLDLTSTAHPPFGHTTLMTANGLYAYGAEFWGQCCARRYNLTYDTDAPFVALAWQQGGLNIGGALRYDMGKAGGTYVGASIVPYDIDGDGHHSRPEERVPIVNNSNPSVVHYSTHYLSWMVNANYAITDHLAVFAGVSRGGRTNADRLEFGNIAADGSVSGGQSIAVNMVTQVEGGLKYGADNFSIQATPFYASTAETNYDLTTFVYKNEVYHAYGLELETDYQIGGLALSGGATYTHSRIVKDLIHGFKGNTPQRQADFVYQASANYTFDPVTVGLEMFGTTDAYVSDENLMIQPGYVLFNGFVQYAFGNGMVAALNAKNIFDSMAITEVRPTTAPTNGYMVARSMTGRTLSLNLRYQF